MKNTSSNFLFFTGKGGVGKTSLACASAIKFADEGKRVLLISTDPASNLEDVLQSPVENEIKPHEIVGNLFTININPEVSAQEYRDRATAPLEGVAPQDEINKVVEQLSGACTTRALHQRMNNMLTGNDDVSNICISKSLPPSFNFFVRSKSA